MKPNIIDLAQLFMLAKFHPHKTVVWGSYCLQPRISRPQGLLPLFSLKSFMSARADFSGPGLARWKNHLSSAGPLRPGPLEKLPLTCRLGPLEKSSLICRPGLLEKSSLICRASGQAHLISFTPLIFRRKIFLRRTSH